MDRRMPGHIAIFGVVVTLATVTSGYFMQEDAVTNLVFKEDVPAYVQISEDMIQSPSADPDEGGTVRAGTPSQLLHRYTIAAVEGGIPIPEDRLGPPLEPGLLTGRQVLSIEVADAHTVKGSVERGMSVTLMFAPKGDGAMAATFVTDALCLDHETSEGGGRNYVFAVPETDLKTIALALARATVVIVR